MHAAFPSPIKEIKINISHPNHGQEKMEDLFVGYIDVFWKLGFFAVVIYKNKELDPFKSDF